jgi:DNA-binding SARP family transcriptional activator
MLKLQLLGSPAFHDAGRDVEAILRRPKSLALLAYLAAARPRGFQRRDSILALFWPELDQAHARNALRQAVHSLRHEIGAQALIGRGEDELGIDPSCIWCDVTQFEKDLEAGHTMSALGLYRREFLAGFHTSAGTEFEHWLDQERKYLAKRALDGALELSKQTEHGDDLIASVRWARRAIEIEPYDESALRRLLRLLDHVGRRADAVREYEDFADRLALDLDVAPSPETRALMETIRARVEPQVFVSAGDLLPKQAAAEPVRFGDDPTGSSVDDAAHAIPKAAPVTPDSVSRGSRAFRLGLGLVVAVTVASVVIVRSYGDPPLDGNLVAVAPFDVLDQRFDLWHEGLVDYLSRNLDGAGPLRTVSPTVVLRRWQGPADPTSARYLGRRTGARLVVFGQVVSAGFDSARVRATLLDATTGHVLAELEHADIADRIDRLADSLTTRLLSDLGRLRSETRLPLASVNTKSLPALKAFLRGEQLLRRFSLDSAIQAYEEAVEDDNDFALALRHLQLARAWRGQTGGSLSLAAGRSNHGLAPRDSLLIVADSLEAASDNPLDREYWSHRARKLSTLEEASHRYPDDPEVWYELGEARFHLGYVVQSTVRQTLDAFNRAIALDSAFAPAYIHPIQLALDWNDIAAATHYIDGYIGLTSGVPEGAGIRLVGQFIERPGNTSSELRATLDTASANVLFDAWRALQRQPDADEASVHLLRLLASGRRGVGVSSDTSATRYLLATELLYRGDLRAARSMIGSRLSVPYGELAALGIVPADSAVLTFDRWLHSANERATIADPPWVTRCYRSFLAAGWWARRQDTLALLSLMRRGDAIARLGGGVVKVVDARADANLARAALALARRDTAEALRQFVAFPDSLCGGLSSSLAPSLAPLHLMRFELLAATGHDREAALLFDQHVTAPLTTGSVMATLERGRIAERLGDRVTAVRMYRFVVGVWAKADPELRGHVSEARVALTRLTGKPR